MSIELQPPSPQLAERLLMEVPYDQRLTGVHMHCLQGPVVFDLYSVDLAVRFMRSDDLDTLHDPVSGASFGYVDPRALTWWLENVFGDTELAQSIEEVTADTASYFEQLDPMRELLIQRLEQCEELAGGMA